MKRGQGKEGEEKTSNNGFLCSKENGGYRFLIAAREERNQAMSGEKTGGAKRYRVN